VTFFVVRVGNFWRFNSGFFKKKEKSEKLCDFFGFFVFALWFLML